ERGRVSLVGARRPLAVAQQERVVRLGARARGPADPVTRRTRDRLRAAEQVVVHAPEGPRGRLLPAAEAVRIAVLVLEDERAEIVDVGEAEPSRGERVGVERRIHRADERPRRGGLAEAPQAAALGEPMGLARGVETDPGRPGDPRAVGAPLPRLLVRGAPARDADEHGRERERAGHGAKTFGWRVSDARKTRTPARSASSSARYASRAAVASPPCSTIASCTVGARPSWRYGAVSARPQSGRVRNIRAGIVPCGAGLASASPMSWRFRSLKSRTR